MKVDPDKYVISVHVSSRVIYSTTLTTFLSMGEINHEKLLPQGTVTLNPFEVNLTGYAITKIEIHPVDLTFVEGVQEKRKGRRHARSKKKVATPDLQRGRKGRKTAHNHRGGYHRAPVL